MVLTCGTGHVGFWKSFVAGSRSRRRPSPLIRAWRRPRRGTLITNHVADTNPAPHTHHILLVRFAQLAGGMNRFNMRSNATRSFPPAIHAVGGPQLKGIAALRSLRNSLRQRFTENFMAMEVVARRVASERVGELFQLLVHLYIMHFRLG